MHVLVPCERKESKVKKRQQQDRRGGIDLVWFLGWLKLTSPCRSLLRLPLRRNVAVGAPAGDHGVGVLHRPRRRLRVPENHLRGDGEGRVRTRG